MAGTKRGVDFDSFHRKESLGESKNDAVLSAWARG